MLGRSRKCMGTLVLEEDAVPVSDEQALPALLQASSRHLVLGILNFLLFK